MSYARKAKLAELEFLELALHDEIARRDERNLAVRLERAGFEEEQTLEGFDWEAAVSLDRDRVRDLFTLGFVERQEDVIFLGPVGVGKTFEATIEACEVAFSGLGYAPCGSFIVEDGYEKVAIYGVGTRLTHAARQLADGTWTSKLGKCEDISHELTAIEGSLYGAAIRTLRRSRP